MLTSDKDIMKVLVYEKLGIKQGDERLKKIITSLESNDFTGAGISKLKESGYYRAKLDYENRLLLSFARFNDEMFALLLEYIPNHRYEKSRFLRGIPFDDAKLHPIVKSNDITGNQFHSLSYLNRKSTEFHFLDKVLSFDDCQTEVLRQKLPAIIIGSAGSGKTALALEMMKKLKGNILYLSLSSYLIKSAASVYYSNNYNNENQEIDFLSFRELINTLRISEVKPVTSQAFNQWFSRHRPYSSIKNSYKLYEEFKGVISGLFIDKPFLSQNDYLNLGVRQSIFLRQEREEVYDLFTKYLKWIQEESLSDDNILCFQYLDFAKPEYDYVIIDEIQDLTNIQIFLALKMKKENGSFLFSGDSNQIVHPNFFSWSGMKRMFFENQIGSGAIHILKTNYRNSVKVTEIANNLLKIKFRNRS